MRFDRESWRKLYVAESIEHRALPLFTRGLRDYLLRGAQDDGTLLRSTKAPAADLARVLAPKDETERKQLAEGIRELLAIGYLTHSDGRLWITRFEEAQLARSPGAKRQAAWRANNQDLAARRAKLSTNYELIRRLRQHDGGECSYCGITMDFRVGKTPTSATIDHLMPMSRGGGDEDENLVLCCRSCNEQKNNRTPGEAGLALRNAKRLSERGVSVLRDVTRDAHETSQREETRRDETTTTSRDVAEVVDLPIPCPADLCLTEGQISTLLGALVPADAIPWLTARFVANYQADPEDKRTLVVWRKCLSKAISSGWNDGRTKQEYLRSRESKANGTDDTGGYGSSESWG